MAEEPQQKPPRTYSFQGLFALFDSLRQSISPQIEPSKGRNDAMSRPTRGEGNPHKDRPRRGEPGRDDCHPERDSVDSFARNCPPQDQCHTH